MLPPRPKPSQPPRWAWLIAALIACAGAGVLLYFGREARPLWLDEEMLGLNARDRSFTPLSGSPTGRILLPGFQTAASLLRPQGCVTIKRAHRW